MYLCILGICIKILILGKRISWSPYRKSSPHTIEACILFGRTHPWRVCASIAIHDFRIDGVSIDFVLSLDCDM